MVAFRSFRYVMLSVSFSEQFGCCGGLVFGVQ